MHIAFVTDPIEQFDEVYESTVMIIAAAQRRGWSVSLILQADLMVWNCEPHALAQPVTLTLGQKPWYHLGASKLQALTDFDVIVMRKDPPFDMNYIYATYILELAEQQGVRVLNRPQSLRDFNEKMAIQWFPQCMPPTLVTAKKFAIKAFYAEHQDIIIKPLDSAGGAAIFRLRPNDSNFNVIWELMTGEGKRLVMVQRYLPAVANGDKRVLLINGEPIPHGVARIAAAGENRANISVGATSKGVPLTERDYWLCAQIAPTLKAKGLYCVGIDIIGDYITEINVTSPGLFRLFQQYADIDVGEIFMEGLV